MAKKAYIPQTTRDMRGYKPQTGRDMSGYKPQMARDMSGYVPQTMRDMNTGYTPQTQMTNEQLAQKAYGAKYTPQEVMMGAQLLKREQTMIAAKRAAAMRQEAMNQQKAEKIAGAVDGVLAENVQLKKQINLNQIQLQKEKTINQGRQKPIDITKKRTGK
jgi:hypothetical protein